MFKKIAIVGISALLLGGCTLGDVFKSNKAATDQMPAIGASSKPVPITTSDSNLDVIPTTSSSTDVGSLENDITSTKILDEDLSNLN